MADPFVGPPALPDELYGIELPDEREEPEDLASEALELPPLSDVQGSSDPVAQVSGTESFDPALIDSIKKDLADDSKWPGVPPQLLAQVRSDFGVAGTPQKNPNDTTKKDWAKQNPVASGVEKLGETAKEAVPYNPMTYVGQAFSQISDWVQPAFDTAKAADPLHSAGQFAGGGLPLEALSRAGQEVNKLGDMAISGADQVAESGHPLAAAHLGALGGLAKMIPAKEADVALTLLPTEKAVSPLANTGKNVVKEFSRMMEDVSSFLPGASVIKDAYLSQKANILNNATLRKRVETLGREMTNLKDRIIQKETEHAGVLPDSIEYGQAAKKGLEFQEELAKAPLAIRSTELKNRPSLQKPYPVSDIGEKALDILDDLTGVVRTSKDSQVASIMAQYLPQKWSSALKEFTGEVSTKEAATVADLLKDRGRVGQAYMRLLKKGVLDTEQSRALLAFQSVLDDAIERRLSNKDIQVASTLVPGERQIASSLVPGTKSVETTKMVDTMDQVKAVRQIAARAKLQNVKPQSIMSETEQAVYRKFKTQIDSSIDNRVSIDTLVAKSETAVPVKSQTEKFALKPGKPIFGKTMEEGLPIFGNKPDADPSAIIEAKALRRDWAQFYNKYASDVAVAIKKSAPSEVLSKINKNASAVEQARQILPTSAFEKMADHEASILMRDMSSSSNPSEYLAKQLQNNPGYYERLLGQNQVESMKVLSKQKMDYAGMKTDMEKLGTIIAEAQSMAKRRRDIELFANLKRKGDWAKAAISLGSGSVLGAAGTIAFFTNSPILATSLMSLGVAPGAFAFAYYSGGRGLRAAAEKALVKVGRLGPKIAAKEAALIRGMAIGTENVREETKP